MLGFIKVFFQGILYVLLSPFLLLALILNLIYSVFVYFAYEIKSIFLFFRGVSYKSLDDESRTLKEIKNSMSNISTNPVLNPVPVQQAQPSNIDNNEDGGVSEND